MTRKVVHLTSVHYAFDTRIFHRECRSLALAGYDVTLIAPHSEGDQLLNGVKLRAVKLPFDRRERMTHTIWTVYKTALHENADVYHFHDPELLPVGALLRMRGKKTIYDVHEDYKGTMEGKQWLPSVLQRPAALAVSVCESTLGRACDRIIAATPTIAKKFRPQKTRLVQNYPWLHELQSRDAPPYEKRDAIAIFVGWLGDHSGIDSMKKAIELVSEKNKVKLLIGGKLKPGALATFDTEAKSEWVEYLGFLSRPQVAKLISRARMGIVTVLPLPSYVNAQPTKMFEYMSGGLPVIASDFPVYRRIVESANCGILVDPQNPKAISEAIVWLMQNPSQAYEMGQNGKRAVSEKYNWELEAKTLIATYEELLPQR